MRKSTSYFHIILLCSFVKWERFYIANIPLKIYTYSKIRFTILLWDFTKLEINLLIPIWNLFWEEISACAEVHTHQVMDGSDRMQIQNSLASYDGVRVTLTRLIVSEQLKTELWIFEHKEILRCKRNSISKVLKDVFCYYSFSLGFQLMKVTEYLLYDTTDILIKFLPQENKRCSCNKTKKFENSLNNNFFYLWIRTWHNH